MSITENASGQGKKEENLVQPDLKNAASVTLLSNEGASRHATEKIKASTPTLQHLEDCDTLSKTELRNRYPGEANSHRNMLARRKNCGAIVHSAFLEFGNFLRLVGPKPAKSATLDRIDNQDPEYGPGKVRWADKRTQSNNRSNTLIMNSSKTGKTYTASRLAKLQGVKGSTIRQRHRRGWTDDEIIEGKRRETSRRAFSTKNPIQKTALNPKFPAGLYSPEQLAILNRSEGSLTWVGDIAFHRDAYTAQDMRKTEGCEYMLPTYAELIEICPQLARVTRDGHRRHFLRWWKNMCHHVVFENLRPDQQKMIADYAPDWLAQYEADKRKKQTQIADL